MKKIISLFLVMNMMFSLCAMAEINATDQVYFQSSMIDSLNYKAKEWFDSSENRALLTILFALEISSQFPNEKFDCYNSLEPSYVGKNGPTLFIVYCNETRSLIVTYQPISGEAAYNVVNDEALNESILEIALRDTCEDGYYKNDVEDIVDVCDALIQIMES